MNKNKKLDNEIKYFICSTNQEYPFEIEIDTTLFSLEEDDIQPYFSDIDLKDILSEVFRDNVICDAQKLITHPIKEQFKINYDLVYKTAHNLAKDRFSNKIFLKSIQDETLIINKQIILPEIVFDFSRNDEQCYIDAGMPYIRGILNFFNESSWHYGFIKNSNNNIIQINEILTNSMTRYEDIIKEYSPVLWFDTDNEFNQQWSVSINSFGYVEIPTYDGYSFIGDDSVYVWCCVECGESSGEVEFENVLRRCPINLFDKYQESLKKNFIEFFKIIIEDASNNI